MEKIIGRLLGYAASLDMEGNERGSKANYNKYRERFQDQNRLSWIKAPGVHAVGRGNVMFRTGVARHGHRVRTPGLMELVQLPDQTWPRRARGVGMHPRIWSVHCRRLWNGKTVCWSAFEWYADSEALVIGVYRNVEKPRGRRRQDLEGLDGFVLVVLLGQRQRQYSSSSDDDDDSGDEEPPDPATAAHAAAHPRPD